MVNKFFSDQFMERKKEAIIKLLYAGQAKSHTSLFGQRREVTPSRLPRLNATSGYTSASRLALAKE